MAGLTGRRKLWDGGQKVVDSGLVQAIYPRITANHDSQDAAGMPMRQVISAGGLLACATPCTDSISWKRKNLAVDRHRIASTHRSVHELLWGYDSVAILLFHVVDAGKR
jgi:hypothetical protein